MTPSGPVEVTIVNADSWLSRPQQLAQLLAGATGGGVISDPAGRAPDPERLVALSDPAYWSQDPLGLGDALGWLADTGHGAPAVTPGRAAGAVSATSDRLTLTVEEAAATLGISRAFAYEAVRRGEIPSIRIGRRVLVPRAALERMLDVTAGDPEVPD